MTVTLGYLKNCVFSRLETLPETETIATILLSIEIIITVKTTYPILVLFLRSPFEL
jgi:hypothetical protein